MFGSRVQAPLVQAGQSGEGIPTVILDPPQPIHVGAQNVTLIWRRLTPKELDQKILGHFRGFRLEWCEAHLTEELCNFYKAYQVTSPSMLNIHYISFMPCENSIFVICY